MPIIKMRSVLFCFLIALGLAKNLDDIPNDLLERDQQHALLEL